MLEQAPSIPQGGSFEVYKIIEFVNSEYLETLNTKAPFTFRGKGWGWGLLRPWFLRALRETKKLSG